jgi:hypothetical protein
MDSSFCLGERVWYTPMVLWLIFGGSTLGICGVMRIGILGVTVHIRVPARTERTVRLFIADSPRGPGSHACDK